MSHCDVRHFFTKYIDVEKNGDSNNWCTKNIDVVNDTYYHGDIVNIAFNGILKQCISGSNLMIKKLDNIDSETIEKISNIWLNSNLDAHDFIKRQL